MLVLGDDRLYAKFLPWSVMRRFAKLCWLEGFLTFSFCLCTSFKHVGGFKYPCYNFQFLDKPCKSLQEHELTNLEGQYV